MMFGFTGFRSFLYFTQRKRSQIAFIGFGCLIIADRYVVGWTIAFIVCKEPHFKSTLRDVTIISCGPIRFTRITFIDGELKRIEMSISAELDDHGRHQSQCVTRDVVFVERTRESEIRPVVI